MSYFIYIYSQKYIQGSLTDMSNLFDLLMQQIQCPITRQTIINPVVALDGHTYQQEALQKWLLKSQKSPITGEKISPHKILPNYALKSLTQKIITHLPLYQQKISQLQTQLKQQKTDKKQLTQLMQFERQKFLQQEQISKKCKKQFKIEQKIGEMKDKMLQKQANKVRQLNLKQSLMKRQMQQLKTSYQNRIKKLQNQIKKMKQEKSNKLNIRQQRTYRLMRRSNPNQTSQEYLETFNPPSSRQNSSYNTQRSQSE